MTNQEVSVVVERTALGQYQVTNARGGTLTLRTEDSDFTAVELLLAGIGGCTMIDVDHLTSRRAEPSSLEVTVSGEKGRTPQGNQLENLSVTFRASYPDGEAGDAARDMLPRAIDKSHTRLCTVSRTVEAATPIKVSIEKGRPAS